MKDLETEISDIEQAKSDDENGDLKQKKVELLRQCEVEKIEMF